ncbi:MAG: hypothetical protein GQ527_00820, partial [Bacteroidales bacterium]|nr:hypothetical protein [Bacteroidales bacterium]
MSLTGINILKTSRVRFLSGFLMLLFLSPNISAENNLWFSNKPPADEKRTSPSGMHGLSSMKGKRGMSFIVQWLRQGNQPLTSQYVHISDSDYEFFLYSPTAQDAKGEFLTDTKTAYLKYAGAEEGYYTAYFIQKHCSNDTLYVDIAKAEMLNHSCRNGHKNERKKIGPNIYPETIPAELVRKRNSVEDFHYFAASGDEVDYQFLINGKPVENAKLIFNTQTAWHKTLITNENGEATFQILQDYFSSWQELNNRKVFDYVIFGQATVLESGTYQNQTYS